MQEGVHREGGTDAASPAAERVGCAGACAKLIAELRLEARLQKCRAHLFRAMHRKALKREQGWKEERKQLREQVKHLQGQLRDRQLRHRSEKRKPAEGRSGAVPVERRPRGQQCGAPGHGRREHSELPVEVEVVELEPSQRHCRKCGREYGASAGSERSQTLEIEVRAYRRVIQRQRYRRSCECGSEPRTITAPPAARLISGGILGISVWVTVLLDKYLLQRPTNRLLEDLRDHGLDLAAGTVTDGLQRLTPLFAPLYQALIERSRLATHWHADETRWQVYETDSEKPSQRWCLWVFQSREVVVYTLDPTRAARVPKEHFAGVEAGIVSADRLSSYKSLAKEGALQIAYCWAHVRRDFIRLANEREVDQEWAEQWLAGIAELYRWHRRRQQARCQSAAWRAADSGLRAAVAELHKRLHGELGQRRLALDRKKVLTSLERHWDGLTLFVEHPEVAIDNNPAERALRGPVVGRKNYYGSGTRWSGTLAATLFSLFGTLRLWQINPRIWLTEYLSACAHAGGKAPADCERFLPWNRAAGHPLRASPEPLRRAA